MNVYTVCVYYQPRLRQANELEHFHSISWEGTLPSGPNTGIHPPAIYILMRKRERKKYNNTCTVHHVQCTCTLDSLNMYTCACIHYILVLYYCRYMKTPWERFGTLRCDISPFPRISFQHPDIIKATAIHSSIYNKFIVPSKGGMAFPYGRYNTLYIRALPLKRRSFFNFQ